MNDYLNLEYQIIGAFIIDKNTRAFINMLEKEDFIDECAKNTFEAIKSLNNKGEMISASNINKLTKISAGELVRFTTSVATTKSIESDVKNLKEMSNKRKIKQRLTKALKNIDEDKDFIDIKNEVLGEIQELKGIEDRGIVKINEITDEIASRVLRGEKIDKGIKTGIPKLDMIIGGFKKGQLITIGAETGVGKSMLATQFAINATCKENKRVLFVSLEMSYEQIGYRLLSATADVDSLDVYDNNLTDEERYRFGIASNKFMESELYLDNTSKKTQDIRSKLLEKEYDMLVVDYLQLLDTSGKNQSREREVASISRDLKSISFEFDMPVLMLSQLNRAVNGSSPTLANLRESGAIEHDSDVVIFIYEPEGANLQKKIEQEYSPKVQQILKSRNQSLVEITVAKQRAGRKGTFDAVKDGKRSTFIEIDTKEY